MSNQVKYLTLESERTPRKTRLRPGEYPELEQCLYLWFIDKIKNGINFNIILFFYPFKEFLRLLFLLFYFKYTLHFYVFMDNIFMFRKVNKVYSKI